MKCDCKKKVTINQFIITKNEVISINPLYYKAPEKSHATEELIDHKTWLLN